MVWPPSVAQAVQSGWILSINGQQRIPLVEGTPCWNKPSRGSSCADAFPNSATGDFPGKRRVMSGAMCRRAKLCYVDSPLPSGLLGTIPSGAPLPEQEHAYRTILLDDAAWSSSPLQLASSTDQYGVVGSAMTLFPYPSCVLVF